MPDPHFHPTTTNLALILTFLTKSISMWRFRVSCG